MLATLDTSKMSTVDALWTLFQSQPKKVREAFIQRIVEEDAETKRQKKLVKDSLTKAMHELDMAKHGKINLKDAKDLFK